MSFYKVLFFLGCVTNLSWMWCALNVTSVECNIVLPANHEFCKIKSNQTTTFVLLSSMSKKPRTILLDLEDDDSTLKPCIIKECYKNGQTVVILSRNTLKSTINKNFMDTHINQYANYILVCNNLDPIGPDEPIMQILKRKIKWSYHDIMITIDDPNYKCHDNGNINEDLLIKIERFLNDLWHRFRIVYVALSLPYVCPDHYFTYDSKKPSGLLLYNRTIKMFSHQGKMFLPTIKKQIRYLSKGYPLRANIFYRFPTAIRDCKNLKYYMTQKTEYSHGFCGLDGIIMSNLVEHFGFNISLSGSRTFGYVLPNGNVSGSLGNVLRGEVDVSFSSRFILPYALSGVTFLEIIWRDCLCVVVRRPLDRPVWFFPVEAYKLRVWLLIIPMLILLGSLSWASNVISSKLKARKKSKVQSMSFHIWDTMLTGFLGFFVGKRPVSYFLKGLCLIYSLIHVTTFQSHANYVFATRIPYCKVSTLQEVQQLGTKVYITPGVKNLIEPPLNDVQKKIFQDNLCLRPAEESSGFKLVLQLENTAYISRRSDAILETALSFSDSNKEPLLSIVNECFRCYYASYICTEGFLFEEAFTRFIQRFKEAGLPLKYYRWTRLTLHIPEKLSILGNRPRAISKIELTDLRIGFILLLTGYFASFIAYLCEIYWARKRGISKR